MTAHAAVAPVFAWHAPVLATLGRAAAQGRLGHAWLLHGQPGTGKTRLAFALAHALLNGVDPRQWETRIGTDAGPQELERRLPERPDLYRLAPPEDRRSIGVDQVREVIDALSLTSHGGGARVVVLTLAEQMTLNASNSLLKTLEEPPSDVYLLLVSHQPGRLPATVRSRCQRVAVPRPTVTQALAWLRRGDAGDTDWALALELAAGSPLAAWQAGREGLVERDRERCRWLADALRARGDALAAAENWLKDDAPSTLDWLLGRLEGVIRDLQGGSSHRGHADYDALLRVCGELGTAGVFRLRDAVSRLRRLSDGGVNLALGLEAALIGAAPPPRH